MSDRKHDGPRHARGSLRKDRAKVCWNRARPGVFREGKGPHLDIRCITTSLSNLTW